MQDPMLVTAVAYWGIGIPTGLVLAFPVELGAQGLWIGLIAGLVAAAIPLCWRFRVVSRRLVARLEKPIVPSPSQMS